MPLPFQKRKTNLADLRTFEKFLATPLLGRWTIRQKKSVISRTPSFPVLLANSENKRLLHRSQRILRAVPHLGSITSPVYAPASLQWSSRSWEEDAKQESLNGWKSSRYLTWNPS